MIDCYNFDVAGSTSVQDNQVKKRRTVTDATLEGKIIVVSLYGLIVSKI